MGASYLGPLLGKHENIQMVDELEHRRNRDNNME